MRKTLAKRKTELANMQDRLLNSHLAGLVDEATFKAKAVELKREAEDVERQMDEAGDFDPKRGELALDVFDFSQNLANLWHGSNFATRREILECVSLNRTLSDVSLGLVKRKPFDILAERPFLRHGRGDCPNFEPLRRVIGRFVAPFLKPPRVYLPAATRLLRASA